ncbi:photosystem II stability/assembly factor HCF136, chloroplastic-like isoform X1 [Primulina eburnea]|uniref:photosystem II stability/assembly factor HCF136, chloroplastic-like isoform X1 n=1 Tax=Primulina eburnea TaxID=1245227 RepID=UPI003C6BEA64
MKGFTNISNSSFSACPLSSEHNNYFDILNAISELYPVVQAYYTGTFGNVNRSPEGNYVAVSSRGNFCLTWEPGQAFWQPQNRAVARRIQNIGWRADGGLWLLVHGGGLYLSKGTGVAQLLFLEASYIQRRILRKFKCKAVDLGFSMLDTVHRNDGE